MAKSLHLLLQEDRLRSSENIFNLKNEPFSGNSYPTNPLHDNKKKLDLFHGHFSEFVKCSSPSFSSDEESLIEDKSPLPLLNHEHQPNLTTPLLSYFLRTSPDGSNVLNHYQSKTSLYSLENLLHDECNVCEKSCNGISYNYPICVSEDHAQCVTMPLSILHKSHPHFLNLVQFSPDPNSYINGNPINSNWLYHCHACQFDLNLGSAIAGSAATPSQSGIMTAKGHAIARTSNPATPLQGEDMTPPRGTLSGANTSNPTPPSRRDGMTTKAAIRNVSIRAPSPAESPQIMRQPSPYYVRQASSNNASTGIPEFGNSYANCIVANGVVFAQASQAGSPVSQSHLDFLQGSPKDAKRVVVITGEVMTDGTIKPRNGAANQNNDGAEMPKSRCCCWLKCLLLCHIGQPH